MRTAPLAGTTMLEAQKLNGTPFVVVWVTMSLDLILGRTRA